MAAMARDGGAPTTEPHALPQYVAVAAELRRLLGVASLYDLAPATQRMIAEVKTHRETVPQMQALIQQLCHTLAVGNADALLPSVQKLATLRRGARRAAGGAAGVIQLCIKVTRATPVSRRSLAHT